MDGGTGAKLGHAAVVVAGVCSLVATLLALISIWLQLKNYRKPLLQRYVVRILLMVPVYAISSWVSLVSLKASFYVDPIRDIYEAFTIYTFFQLLINFLGGERSLIIMMHGRAPKEHLWPLNYIFPKVDISDPHTFLAIKRGILQYAWIKPILGLATIIMKAMNTYQEGYVGLKSGYFWSGLIYNISVSISLYSLGMFWVCMLRDLKPFRPMPKFLCIKAIIFASYWQGFFLSILVWLGVIHDVGYYTPDNIAAAIQDALICFELPGFAIAHWYAFSWKDFADPTISSARMPVLYAFRDALGIRDLIEDTKLTFKGKGYEYRLFDPSDPTALAHPESGGRIARMMEGLRYERGGKGKYWIPKPTARTGLLAAPGPSAQPRALSPTQAERGETRKWYGEDQEHLGQIEIDEEDERLFVDARTMEFGDYNYPVITAYEPRWHHRTRMEYQTSGITTTSTNQALLKPPKGKGKQTRLPPFSHSSSSSSSDFANRPGIVDLVVEDTDAEEVERVRARKEGGPGWNQVEPKKFIRKYPESEAGEQVTEEFPSPLNSPPIQDVHSRGTNTSSNTFLVSPEGEEDNDGSSQEARTPLLDLDTSEADLWKASGTRKDVTNAIPERALSYDGIIDEEVCIWRSAQH